MLNSDQTQYDMHKICWFCLKYKKMSTSGWKAFGDFSKEFRHAHFSNSFAERMAKEWLCLSMRTYSKCPWNNLPLIGPSSSHICFHYWQYRSSTTLGPLNGKQYQSTRPYKAKQEQLSSNGFQVIISTSVLFFFFTRKYAIVRIYMQLFPSARCMLLISVFCQLCTVPHVLQLIHIRIHSFHRYLWSSCHLSGIPLRAKIVLLKAQFLPSRNWV